MPDFDPPLLLPASLLQAQREFGLALLRRVAQATPQANVFISPFGIVVALLLALEGSAGATREAIARTLRVEGIPPAELATAVARQLAVLTQPGEYQLTLGMANGLWVNQNFTLDPDFAARIRQHYRASATALDFTSPRASEVINAWVSQRTAGRISHVAEASSLTEDVALVLTNAVYFKADWAEEFSEAATRPGPFWLGTGQAKTVPLMRQRSSAIQYQRGAGWQAVRLPYLGYPRGASMQVFVPDQPTGLPDFLRSLTAEQWAQWQAAYGGQNELIEVDLTLPRFQLEWQQDLTGALDALGLGPALGPDADFTPVGLPPGTPGFIGQITHRTYLRIDEKGTEAVGVTMMWLDGGAAGSSELRRVEVRVDRPFFCAIVDDETGTILFGGAVYDPA